MKDMRKTIVLIGGALASVALLGGCGRAASAGHGASATATTVVTTSVPDAPNAGSAATTTTAISSPTAVTTTVDAAQIQRELDDLDRQLRGLDGDVTQASQTLSTQEN